MHAAHVAAFPTIAANSPISRIRTTVPLSSKPLNFRGEYFLGLSLRRRSVGNTFPVARSSPNFHQFVTNNPSMRQRRFKKARAVSGVEELAPPDANAVETTAVSQITVGGQDKGFIVRQSGIVDANKDSGKLSPSAKKRGRPRKSSSLSAAKTKEIFEQYIEAEEVDKLTNASTPEEIAKNNRDSDDASIVPLVSSKKKGGRRKKSLQMEEADRFIGNFGIIENRSRIVTRLRLQAMNSPSLSNNDALHSSPIRSNSARKLSRKMSPIKKRTGIKVRSLKAGRKEAPPAEEETDFETVNTVTLPEKQNERDDGVMDSVVKVFCVHTEPNYSLPWQKKRQFSSSSSGFIIHGRRLLTNAHSVEHHTMVKVKKRGSDVKFLATVLAVGTECDIAMLSVEDEGFWKDVTPLDFGPLPRLQDSVTVVGYPIGGDSISVTSGVVSRIEVTSYSHGASELLGVQIDAAINSGNSGGPAFNAQSQCVGIAFQSLKNEDTENIGYIIPTPVIEHFISDFEKTGSYTGFPSLGVEWQKLESPPLRKSFRMSADQKGVLLRRIEPTAPAFKSLKPSDVLLSFDGEEIANDGTVPFRQGERISFSYLVSKKFTGESARLGLLRSGKLLSVEVSLASSRRLVPVHTAGLLPNYYIIAGLLFTTVTVPYLRSEYGKDYEFEAPVKLLDKLVHSMTTEADEEIVVVAQVLAADVNIGYEDIINTQVLRFNDAPIKNLRQLAGLVEQCSQPFMRFDLEYYQLMVLDTKEAKMATKAILDTHSIPSAMSSSLLMEK